MNTENRRLAALLVVAFVARAAYGLYAPAKAPDGSILNIDRYAELAASVADHGALADPEGHPTAIREPGYPMALGLVFKIFGKRYFPFLIFQALLNAGSLWLLFLMGSAAFGAEAALLAVAIGALYPQFIYYSALPGREIWAVFIDLLTLWLLARAIRMGRPRDFGLAGLGAAIAALSATTFLPFGLFIIPALILFSVKAGTLGREPSFAVAPAEAADPSVIPAQAGIHIWTPACAGVTRWPRGNGAGGWASALRRAAIYLVVFVLFYSVWPLRNYAVLNRWVLGTTSAAGNHFYMFMIVPEEIGGTPRHYEILARDPVWRQGDALPPADRENFFWRAGLEKIRQDPLAYARLVAWRFFWDEWRAAPRPRDYGRSYRLIWWASILSDGWIIPLGFLGIVLSRLEPLESRLGLAFIAAVSFAYSLVLTMLRYRLVLMPWMILFAAHALLRLYKRCHPAA